MFFSVSNQTVHKAFFDINDGLFKCLLKFSDLKKFFSVVFKVMTAFRGLF